MTSCADHPRSCGANYVYSTRGVFGRGSSPLVRGQHSCDPTPSSPLRIIPARAGPTRGGRPHCNCGTDHPRSCGANFGLMYVAVPVTGSSPLVRGQPATDNVAAGDVRIIPARAGPTYITVDFDRASTDHPRSCGANVLSRLRWRGHFGSSPLVRGQLVLQLQRQRHARIIPARAGPTTAGFDVVFFGADHPRSCGANCVSWRVVVCTSGSSPLVRGQHLAYLLKSNEWRIIPARAGPTCNDSTRTPLKADHPRSCGANCSPTSSWRTRAGSSPLVRGQPAVDYVGKSIIRIIPARAGPTRSFKFAFFASSDHPRSCGANWMIPARTCTRCGSSPLVRGQLNAQTATSVYTRIIPARAGPTSLPPLVIAMLADHPRSCGANHLFLIQSLTHCGSSPLVRGQQTLNYPVGMTGRIIPARAGPTVR